RLLVSLLGMTLLVGCSSNEPAEKTKEKPAAPKTEEVTGRVAFQKLYVAAHGWAGDARPYRLESGVTKESTGKDGKAAVWRAALSCCRRTPSSRSSTWWIGARAPINWCGT